MKHELIEKVRHYFSNRLELDVRKAITQKGQMIELGFPCDLVMKDMITSLNEHGLEDSINYNIVAHAIKPQLKRNKQIRNVIAVASGKGGVGKSTTAVNLAISLQKQGGRVGLLDADIYGPSCAHMLGIPTKPRENHQQILPLSVKGLQTMSIAYLIESEKTPVIWRGPMVSRALEQLFFNTKWRNLDYLVIDLPPGTGDIALTLMQKIPLTAAIIVTTPQDISLLDAKKALSMFNKLSIPVLGVVENMSTHRCSQCGHEEAIFGLGGGIKLSHENDMLLLAQLPLQKEITEHSDEGEPNALNDDNIGQRYHELALKIAALIAQISPDYSSKFPDIVIEG